MRFGRKTASYWIQSKLSTFFKVNGDKLSQNIPPYGQPLKDKPDNITRIAFQNVNGMKLESEHTGVTELHEMRKMKLDLVGMAETNLYWTQEKKIQLATLARIAFDGTSRCIASSTKANSEGYLPGGTAMISQGSISGRCHARGSDEYGRFTWMAFRGRDDSGLLVITAYRVVQNIGT